MRYQLDFFPINVYLTLCTTIKSTMPRLPAPPRFTMPPPPMPPTHLFEKSIVSHLTCSSIGEQYEQTWTTTRLVLLGGASCLIVFLLFTITLVWLLTFRQQKRSYGKQQPSKKPSSPPIVSANAIHDWTTEDNRSYETVSSDHTDAYLQSVDTSVTTCSMDTSSIVCIECRRQHILAPRPHYHLLHIPDVVPN